VVLVRRLWPRSLRSGTQQQESPEENEKEGQQRDQQAA